MNLTARLARCGLACCLALFALPVVATAYAQEPEWEAWQLLLPMDHPEGALKIAPPHSPEEELVDMHLGGPGPNLEREHVGKNGRSLKWITLQHEDASGGGSVTTELQFADHLPKGPESTDLIVNAAAYLHRTVRCDRAVRIPVTVTSDDGCRVWLNGKLLHETEGLNAFNERAHLVFALEPGANHLFVKVINAGGLWGFGLTPPFEATPEARASMQPAIHTAIDLGVEYLLKTQQRDGSWGYSAKDYHNGQTALSIYALLKSGVAVEHQSIRRGLDYLRLNPPEKTYSTAVQILALAAAQREQDQGWIEQLSEQMLDWQQGDFAYPGGQHDLSCTQYGAFSYWIADQHGVKIPKRAWTNLVNSVLRYKMKDGGFAYRPGGVTSGSMTVAGLTVLAVCKRSLGKGGYPRQRRKELEQAEAEGMRWLSANFLPDQNPTEVAGERTRWTYYYLYGVERLAALLGVDKFGEHDWYWEGAEFLVRDQTDEGAWGTGAESEPNTCFALLFLNRATAVASSSGPGASRGGAKNYVTDDADALVVLRAKGDAEMNLWLSAVGSDLLETHTRAGDAGKGLYFEVVEYLVDGVSVARMQADPTKPWSSEPYALQHRFQTGGTHDLQLKLHFAEIGGTRPAPVLSPLLKVRVDTKLEPWMLDYVDDSESNLLLGTRPGIDASSYLGEADKNNLAYFPRKAIDGLQSTAWVCRADDPAPELRVTFEKPLRIDRLLLSHAASSELQRGDFDRATKVSIQFQGKRETHTFELAPLEHLKTTLPVPRDRVAGFTLRVLERIPGVKHKGSLGFAEIELRLGDEQARKR